MIWLIVFLLWATDSLAVTYYTDPNIGPTSCTTYREAQRDCSGGTLTAYKTLRDSQLAPLAPGDVVLIRGGPYTTTSTDSVLYYDKAGTASQRITYRKYPNETVLVNTTMDGTNSSGPFLIWFNGASYSTFDCVDPAQMTIKGGNYAVYYSG